MTLCSKFRFFFNSEVDSCKKHTCKEGGDTYLYVSSYDTIPKGYSVKVWNMNGITGEEFFETFIIPKNKVKSIETL